MAVDQQVLQTAKKGEATPGGTRSGENADGPGTVASPPSRYWPGLDGMRALAVAAVVIYHMEPTWLPGGFFGVDIFFVISGYLITSLLVSEWGANARIDLPQFWLRRVRRLYPAVVALLVVIVPVAAIVAPTALASTRTTIPAALFYLTNWWFIYHHVPYFQTFGRPPLLIHFWSLAIEEQYYLIWPPILALLLVRWRRPVRIAGVALAAAVGSSVLMAVLFHPGAGTDRIYYGSDTHAQGLLIGSALGLAVPPFRLKAAISQQARRLLDWIGGGAIAVLVMLMLLLRQADSFTWRGGLVLVVALAGVAVVVASHPASRLPRLLGSTPLRWLGKRSYSVYLWHWPILDLTRPHQDVGFGGLPLGVLRLGLILGVAELSYRYIEVPWRTGRAQQLVREVLQRSRRQRQAAIGGMACVAVTVVALVVTAPSAVPPSSIAAGATRAARESIGRVLAPATTTTTTTTTTLPRRRAEHHARSGASATVRPGRSGTKPAAGRLQPPPVATKASTTTTSTTTTTVPKPGAIIRARGGRPVLAIGDSVMLGSSVDLDEAFGPSITVDAEVGRQVSVGIQRLQEYKNAGRLRGLRALVVGLGSNGPFEPSQMHQLVSICRGIPLVVLINVRVPDSWQPTSNATIASVAGHRGFKVVDWNAASSAPGLLYSDGVHPDAAGQVVYTNLVVRAVTGR